ncbi:MAG TPA: sulfite exporter TauE/SafE family protein [Streptosporangiaceae bacterium]|nr:sulfite exporter TauE/SafE family protein [Streptosporangiaceae bacterium]
MAFAAAIVISAVSAPGGVSGAVLLLPFQVSVLGTPSPSVTPTNLLYNVVATPGALYRYWRQGQTGGRLATVLIAGTLPGVIAGSLIRVRLIPGPRVFDLVVASVLLPLGCWLVLTRPRQEQEREQPVRLSSPVIVLIAVVVGCVGGIYGIGGGSILAPILIGAGRPPAQVAPAALASTLVTSVAGVITFTILSAQAHSSVAPNWPTGIALGVGGLLGSYVGARLQSRLPDLLIRRLLGVLEIAIAIRFVLAGLL